MVSAKAPTRARQPLARLESINSCFAIMQEALEDKPLQASCFFLHQFQSLTEIGGKVCAKAF